MKNQRIFITGINGFVGQHLTRHLQAHGAEVEGLGTEASSSLEATYHQVDIRQAEQVEQAIAACQPTTVIHLAGISSVGFSFAHPELTHQVNVEGTRYLLEAMRRHAPEANILVVSSGEVYASASTPRRETDPTEANSPYAESRLAQEKVCADFTDLRVKISRSFNHTGPEQLDTFVTSSFAKQLARIAKGESEPVIEVGNLEAVRDFSDVRDMVQAYLRLLERGEDHTIYNICSGEGVSIADLLQKLIELSGVEVEVRPDPERIRPVDKPVLIGDPSRFKQATGWQPQYGLTQTLGDMLDYWRQN